MAELLGVSLHFLMVSQFPTLMNHDYYVQLCCDEFALGTFCVNWCGMPALDKKKMYIYISIFDDINVNIMTLIGWGGWKNDEDRSHMRQFTSAGFTPLTVLGIQLNHRTCALSSWKAPRVRPTCHCCWQRYACWWKLPFGWAHYHWPWIKPGWWLTYPSEKIWKSVGNMIPHIWKNLANHQPEYLITETIINHY